MDGRVLNGLIIKISISHKSMSLSEIETMFENVEYNLSENLVGQWKFDAGTGNLAYDHSGNANHGTINGATWEEVISGCTDPYAGNYNVSASK